MINKRINSDRIFNPILNNHKGINLNNKNKYENISSCKCNSTCSCNGNCGKSCKCTKFYAEDDDKLVFFNDDSYAVYRLGKWRNNYKLNLLGIDNEIPATQITKNQSLNIIDEIRKYNFNFKGFRINGMVGLAIRFNGLQNEDVGELIDTEEKEYYNIKNELNKLKLENPSDFIEINNEKFLIYKLRENCHGAILSKPVNEFTRKYSTVYLSKIKLSGV